MGKSGIHFLSIPADALQILGKRINLAAIFDSEMLGFVFKRFYDEGNLSCTHYDLMFTCSGVQGYTHQGICFILMGHGHHRSPIVEGFFDDSDRDDGNSAGYGLMLRQCRCSRVDQQKTGQNTPAYE